MKIEEAIVCVLATRGNGLTTEQIASEINRQRLHLRKDGQPVSGKQVYAVICLYPQLFIKEDGRIRIMM